MRALVMEFSRPKKEVHLAESIASCGHRMGSGARKLASAALGYHEGEVFPFSRAWSRCRR